MTGKKGTMTDEKRREEARKRFEEEMRKNPDPISDEEFMAEFEVSDEEYERGITLPAPGGRKS